MPLIEEKELRANEERLKRFKKNIERLAAEIESDAMEAFTNTQLTARIDKLVTIWIQYESTHLDLVGQASSQESINEYNDEYESIDDLVTKVKDKCNARINALNATQLASETSANATTAANDGKHTGVTIITGDGLNNIS